MLPLPLLVAAALFAAPAAAAEARPFQAQLERAGFALQGEARTRGDLLLVEARRRDMSWLLVIDRRTGTIVGQRPLGGLPPPPAGAD